MLAVLSEGNLSWNPNSGLCIKVKYFNALFIYFSGNLFLCNIDNTKFESYLQSCFEILFVLSKFEIIKLSSIVMNAVNIISEHVNISYWHKLMVWDRIIHINYQ